MISSCIYTFTLAIAILAIGGTALPLRVRSVEASSHDYDYYEEKYIGKFTGPWVADTLSCFDRVHAVIEHNWRRHTERFVEFSESLPNSQATYIDYSIDYARDFRTETAESQSLATPYNTYYLKSSACAELKDDQVYPLNKEAVWQIPIPKNHITYVVLNTFDLEEPQDGSCINDFVSVYADDETPVKFCSSLDLVEESIPAGAERLTIRFQSNEANNLGGFSGAVHFTPVDQPVTRRDVSRTQAEESAAAATEELDQSNEDETEQALACLVDISKHGESAAAKYMENAPNAECKKMAEAFFQG